VAGVQPPIWRAVLSESPLREGLGILHEKARQFWNSPCATKCLSIGRGCSNWPPEIAIRTSKYWEFMSTLSRDKECHSISFRAPLQTPAKTKLGSPDLDCLHYHVNDLSKYEFWMLGPDEAVRKMLGNRCYLSSTNLGKHSTAHQLKLDGSFDASARALSAVTVQSLCFFRMVGPSSNRPHYRK
jgi:hypothetical protein